MFKFREVERNWDTEREVTRDNQPYMQIKPKTEMSQAELVKAVEDYWRNEVCKAHEEALKES